MSAIGYPILGRTYLWQRAGVERCRVRTRVRLMNCDEYHLEFKVIEFKRTKDNIRITRARWLLDCQLGFVEEMS